MTYYINYGVKTRTKWEQKLFSTAFEEIECMQAKKGDYEADEPLRLGRMVSYFSKLEMCSSRVLQPHLDNSEKFLGLRNWLYDEVAAFSQEVWLQSLQDVFRHINDLKDYKSPSAIEEVAILMKDAYRMLPQRMSFDKIHMSRGIHCGLESFLTYNLIYESMENRFGKLSSEPLDRARVVLRECGDRFVYCSDIAWNAGWLNNIFQGIIQDNVIMFCHDDAQETLFSNSRDWYRARWEAICAAEEAQEAQQKSTGVLPLHSS